MAHPFPEEAQQAVKKEFTRFTSDYKFSSAYRIVREVCYSFQKDNNSYGFLENLRTGHYVHYEHERVIHHTFGYNCTTIIPTLYMWIELAGFSPQIVEFSGFRDLKKRTKKSNPRDQAVHYAIIADLGKKNPYLIDPFWSIFGPILEDKPGRMKIGRTGNSGHCQREYDSRINFKAEDFAEMINRLRDPGESLDMLVAGQKIYNQRWVSKFNCSSNIYYDDDTNILTSRLYIPQDLVSNKAILGRKQFDDLGNIVDEYLEFYYAQDVQWRNFIGGQKIARINHITAGEIRQLLRTCGVNINKHQRIGPALDNQKNAAARTRLLEIADFLINEIGTDISVVKPKILAQTLYQAEKPMGDYVYSQQERDARIKDLRAKERMTNDLITKIYDTGLYWHNWKVDLLSRNESRRLKRKKKKLSKESNKTVDLLISLLRLRYSKKPIYDRLMDKVLYSASIKSQEAEQAELAVTQRRLDPRVGYLSMVVDFLPFAFEAKDVLTLKNFMGPIPDKIRTRRAKKYTQL